MKTMECPRDAFQGVKNFIPTETKVNYYNKLLNVGFDMIDIGSFVSPKVIPQMRDISDVISSLDMSNTKTELLSIVANKRGAEEASKFDSISYLGFPFSISNTFLERNINSNIEDSLLRGYDIIDVCKSNGKEIVVYFSMGFGNPYGDEWSLEIIDKYVELFINKGVKIISLSDTIGVSSVENIKKVFKYLINKYDIEFGFHLHSEENKWKSRIESAYNVGIRRFDSVIGGYGGCPLALANKLVGNLDTINFVDFCKNKNISLKINYKLLNEVAEISEKIISKYG